MKLVSKIFLSIALLALILPLATNAQLPFGGKVIITLPCTCTLNFLITMVPAAATLPARVIFRPGVSILYEYYQFFAPGTALLGKTLGFDTCWEGIPPFCVPLSIGTPLVQMMGTSLGPAI